jgi:hypothetical protein
MTNVGTPTIPLSVTLLSHDLDWAQKQQVKHDSESAFRVNGRCPNCLRITRTLGDTLITAMLQKGL